jgi:tetratricopeptide (TPR) repeat protein
MASSARIDELLKKFDENPRRYFAPLANEYRKAGDLEQAIFICQEYLPQQPGHMSGHIVYGQALFELNRHDEAKTVFETALSLDPENLIALRHLGDIARIGGDSANARIWYQRVLEADPRNEEIAQLMLALLAPPASETAPVGSPVVDHNAPTPLNNPAIQPDSDASGFAVEKAPDDSALSLDATPEPEPAAAEAPIAEPPAPRTTPSYTSRHAPKEDELLDLDSFDLGGVPLSSLRSNEPAESPQPESMPEPPAPVMDHDSADQSIELDQPFEADPFAIAATPLIESQEQSVEPPIIEESERTNAPEIELASDIALGLPDDGVSPSFTSEGEALDGLETFEPGIIADKPVDEPPPIEASSFFDLPSAPPAEEAGEEQTDAAPAPTAAFVTETMATLYLQQGHLDSALDIYRQLVELRPDDEGLRARMAEVEAQVNGAAASMEDFPEMESPAPAPRTYGGPTIREFLTGIVSRRKLAFDEPLGEPSDLAESQGEMQVPVDEPVAESAPVEPPMPAMRGTPSSSETVSGSLGALFSGADASENDDRAAQTLADAFASDGPETTPLQGVPAHRASSELSLNHVFKGTTPQRSSSGGEDFSFDQFFTEEVSASPETESSESAAAQAGEGADDIAQFNAWLNGLKKS